MKLSICLPIYNTDVSELVSELKKQIQNVKDEVEILIIDDASDIYFSEINSKINNVFYLQLYENIGRSAIRNRFLKYAKGEYLLFLDCDVRLPKEFLKNYIDYIEQHDNLDVVFGGFQLEDESAVDLRSRYSKAREIHSVEKRLTEPIKSFKTVNFLVRRQVFEQINFDEEIKTYGYEDYIFAQQLKKNAFAISHIGNPVLHKGDDRDEDFVVKTEMAIETLFSLMQNDNYKDDLSDVTLLKYEDKLRKKGMLRIFRFYFKRNKTKIRKKLCAGNASLHYLDIYKLGLLLEKKNA